jgi:phage terminase small subunit
MPKGMTKRAKGSAEKAVRPLTGKQQLFVQEYLKDLNATQAAIRAGYSAKTASSQGERLLRNVEVQKAVTEQMASRSARVQIDADWMLQRLGEDVEADMADLYGEDGNLKPVQEWPPIWRKGLVAGVETIEEKDDDGKVTGIVRKVKLADRTRLKEMLGKHVDVQAFKDRVEHGLSDDLVALIAAGDARVRGQKS